LSICKNCYIVSWKWKHLCKPNLCSVSYAGNSLIKLNSKWLKIVTITCFSYDKFEIKSSLLTPRATIESLRSWLFLSCENYFQSDVRCHGWCKSKNSLCSYQNNVENSIGHALNSQGI
jgi:hypothetical protein